MGNSQMWKDNCKSANFFSKRFCLFIYLDICVFAHTHTHSVQCVRRDQKIALRIQFSSTLCGFSGLNLEYQGVAEDDMNN